MVTVRSGTSSHPGHHVTHDAGVLSQQLPEPGVVFGDCKDQDDEEEEQKLHDARIWIIDPIQDRALSSRYVLPPLKHPKDIFGYSQAPRQDKTPIQKLTTRLKATKTPIIDRLYGPMRQFAYFAKDDILALLLRKLEARKTAYNEWSYIFEFVPKDNALAVSRRRRRKSRTRSYNLQPHQLRNALRSGFGNLPYEPQACREVLEKILTPLVVANRPAFPELWCCSFWSKWDDVRCVKRRVETDSTISHAQLA